MKKSYFLLLPFIVIKLSGQVIECPAKNQKGYTCGNVEEKILETLENKTYRMRSHFNIKLVTAFENKTDNEKAPQIAALCEKVLNDADFWNALENYKHYKYAVFENKKEQKQAVTGPEIINCMINAAPGDTTRPANVDVLLSIELYGGNFRKPFESAVGQEIGDGKIYNKKWFFRNASIEDIGSNWIHEFSHSKGLFHCYYCHQERDYSVPYVINRLFVQVAKKYK